MRKIFGSDTPLFKLMTTLMELAGINLLFLLCSLPLVTVGASCTALFRSLYELHHYGEGCFTARNFLSTFRKSCKSAVPVWCVGALAMAALAYSGSYWVFSISGTSRIVLCGVYAALLILIAGTLQLLFFFLAMTGKWNRDYMKDAFLLALAKYPQIILTTLLILSPLVLFLMTGSMLLRLLPLILLFWIACPGYVCVWFYTRILRPLYPQLFEEEQ